MSILEKGITAVGTVITARRGTSSVRFIIQKRLAMPHLRLRPMLNLGSSFQFTFIQRKTSSS